VSARLRAAMLLQNERKINEAIDVIKRRLRRRTISFRFTFSCLRFMTRPATARLQKIF